MYIITIGFTEKFEYETFSDFMMAIYALMNGRENPEFKVSFERKDDEDEF